MASEGEQQIPGDEGLREDLDERPLGRRVLGVPLVFAVAYAAVGFSLYFSLGVVAGLGLGLTPLLFLGTGLMFVMATMSFAEGGSMFPGRGGSATLARHAFNELVSFIAGWALLIDLIVIVALAAVTAPHYLTPIWDGFGDGAGEVLAAVAVVVAVAFINIRGYTGASRGRILVALALGDLFVQFLIIAVGLLVVFEPGALTAQIDLFTAPTLGSAVYGMVIATVAFAGIEAASDIAPDVRWHRKDLRRSVTIGAALLPLLYAGVAAIALMAVPVVAGPDGPETALGGLYVDEPILGVVQNFDPHWVSVVMQVAVVAVAPAVLFWAASTAMLGISRHVYVLATNRQIPRSLGRLSRARSTPFVAITLAALIAIGLVIPADIEMLAGLYAFGATLSITLAHASVLRLRQIAPQRRRLFRVPGDVDLFGAKLPLPALAGAVLTGLAWLSVVVLHDEARWVGIGWMLFGLVSYIVYRKLYEGTSLTSRIEVPAEALVVRGAEVEYEEILVPVFGTDLDDDIVGTAGRLADAALKPGEVRPRLRVVYIAEVPLSRSLTEPPSPEQTQIANRALERALDVGSEYETVDVQVAVIRARTIGSGIVEAARDMAVEAIVMGGEPPTRVRGGASLGAKGGRRLDEVGPVTEYVLRRAPCRVLLTAPPDPESAVPDPFRPLPPAPPATPHGTL